VTYLEDGDTVVLTRAGAEIRDARGQRANREMRQIKLDTVTIDKRGHKHFMAKEIAEQPVTLGEALNAWVTPTGTRLTSQGLDFSGVSRIVIVACGTAYLSGFVAKYWIEQLARIPVEVDIASEFRYREPPVPEGTLALFISQSGETADTLAALKYLKAQHARCVAIVNQAESSIAREADIVLPIHAGVEVGVASTKAFTNMLAVLAALAVQAGLDTGALSPEAATAHLEALRVLPGLMNTALGDEGKFIAAGRKLAEATDILFLGRGAMYPLALEGALKLKEISYIHAEGYASGELKHGPIALVDDRTPIVVLAPRDGLFDKTVSNMQEVMARGGRILLVTDSAGAEIAGEGVWQTVILPQVDPLWAPILYAIPAQLLAYHTAVAKGTDVDQPRNLAKSVTVE
jgi:glucosamine--fructose-6-phosphate aminotransferase (isomerizing)